jgi:CBS domain-containing protein
MPNAFNFQSSPFDCLTKDEQARVRAHVDVAYFPQDTVILDYGEVPSHLFVIIKGRVIQKEDNEVIGTYDVEDCFDGRGLVAGKSSSQFIAAQEVIAYQLDRQTVRDLIASNVGFGALLFSDLSQKLSVLSNRADEHQVQSLTLTRVDEAFLRPAHFVDEHASVIDVVKLFSEHRISCVLVKSSSAAPDTASHQDNAGRVGIFSSNDLQRAILSDPEHLAHLRVLPFANFKVISVKPSNLVGDALALMLKHRIHRLVVQEQGEIFGVLESLDLFSFLSNHSYLISTLIEEAKDLSALKKASDKISSMMSTLYKSGSKIHLICGLVTELNARLMERAWTLIAPKDLVDNSCLFVMGSEGRGEQLLKTDQDNGLLIRDGYTPTQDVQAITDRFSNALIEFGYPPCPGHIMLSNPEWRMSVQAFSHRIKEWFIMPTPERLMNLAIFMDAGAICGDAALLTQVKESMMQFTADNDVMLSRFASAANTFGNESGWWNKILTLGSKPDSFSIKREAIFPLVHGVRSLALSRNIYQTSTVSRVDELVKAGFLEPAMGQDLIESLHLLIELRFKSGLRELQSAQSVSGRVDLNALSTLERDLLKDTIQVVRRFKVLLSQQFKLDAM